MGGLASQLQKYMLGRYIAEKTNQELCLDLSWYKKVPAFDTPRELSLTKYDLRNYKINNRRPLRPLLIRMINKFRRAIGLKESSKYLKTHQLCKNDIINISHSIEIINEQFGYKLITTQQKKFTSEIKLKKQSNELHEKIENILASSIPCVAIHIRRGDFLENAAAAKHHCVQNKDYYIGCLNELKNDLNNRIKVYVFSDDIEWAENILSDYGCYFIGCSLSDEEQFELMRYFEYYILSSSHYGLLSMWLSYRVLKKVYAPEDWVFNVSENKLIKEELKRLEIEIR